MQIQFTLLSAGMQPGCIQSCIAASLALAVTCLKPGSAAPLCGEGGEADEELAWEISPFTGTQWFILCWDGEKDPPVPPHPQVLSLLRCGAGSPSLPQAALEISPGMRCDSFHLTFFFFFHLQAWKTTAGDFGRTFDMGPTKLLEGLCFPSLIGVFLSVGDVCGKIPCASLGSGPGQGLIFNCFTCCCQNLHFQVTGPDLTKGWPLAHVAPRKKSLVPCCWGWLSTD